MSTPTTPCPRCWGTGEIAAPEMVPDRFRGHGYPVPVRPCGCVASLSVVRELEAVWTGLGHVEPASKSIFGRMIERDQIDVDLVICSPPDALRAHLRAVLDTAPDRRLDTRVASDAELLTAQFCKDVGQRAQDLYLDPGLLVLLLGVQHAKHPMLAGLVLTALAARDQRNLPTWVVYDPARPIRTLLCWSPELHDILSKRLGVRFSSAADPGAPMKIEASQDGAEPAAPASAAQTKMRPQVAQEAARLGWEPGDVDTEGNAWGTCLRPGCTGRFSIYFSRRQRTEAKCHDPSCDLNKARSADQLSRHDPQATKPTPAAVLAAKRPPKLSTRELLARELRCGAGGGVEVLPEALPRSKSALEKALLVLRGEGHTIDCKQGSDRKYRWVCRE